MNKNKNCLENTLVNSIRIEDLKMTGYVLNFKEQLPQAERHTPH